MYNKKELWDDIGKNYHILKYHVFKKYPICYWAQASIAAILKIRDKIIPGIINNAKPPIIIMERTKISPIVFK